MFQLFNSLRPNDAIWRQWSWTALAQVVACCLMAPSHYLNQCWLITTELINTHGRTIPFQYWYLSHAVTKISLNITYSKFYLNLPGTNELIYKWIIAHISHLCNKWCNYIYIADNCNQFYSCMICSRDVTCLFVQDAINYSYSWLQWTHYSANNAIIYWIMQLFIE